MALNDSIPSPIGRAKFTIIPARVIRLETNAERDARVRAFEAQLAIVPDTPAINFERLEVEDLHAGARHVAIGDPTANPERDVLESGWLANLIVTVGKSVIMDRLFALPVSGTAVTPVSAIGVGGVATAAAVGDTQLNNGGTAGNVLLQAFDSVAVRVGLQVSATSTFASNSANFTWQEFAFFNGLTNGTSSMYNHIAPVGPFTKTTAVAIPVTLQTTQT